MDREGKRLSVFVNDRSNPALTRTLLHQDLESTGGQSTLTGVSLRGIAAALMAVCIFALWQAPLLYAQSRKSKVPIVGKLTSSNRRQAYSGKVRSLDMKQQILNVDALHGRDTEIFPFKKNVRVENLNGERMNLTALKPGTTVLIYFKQKAGERTVRNIVVLGSGKEQTKGKSAPSS